MFFYPHLSRLFSLFLLIEQVCSFIFMHISRLPVNGIVKRSLRIQHFCTHMLNPQASFLLAYSIINLHVRFRSSPMPIAVRTRTGNLFDPVEKILRRTHSRCLFPIHTILQISGITVKAVIFQHFFPKGQHII